MRDADEYLAFVKALIVTNDQIAHWTVMREEAQGDVGLFRYKLVLRDDSLLEVFERFRVSSEAIVVSRYSFHWQNAAGDLRKRWDNAPHHRDVPTWPHHVHDGGEANVLPHEPMTIETVLAIISAAIEPLIQAHSG